MQRNLRLIQLPLDLHDTIRLRRVLILCDVLLQLWEVERIGRRAAKYRPWILRQELV